MSTLIRFLVISYICVIPCLASAHGPERPPCHNPDNNGTTAVPELDANSSAAALSLLLGGVIIMSERRRRRG